MRARACSTYQQRIGFSVLAYVGFREIRDDQRGQVAAREWGRVMLQCSPTMVTDHKMFLDSPPCHAGSSLKEKEKGLLLLLLLLLLFIELANQ